MWQEPVLAEFPAGLVAVSLCPESTELGVSPWSLVLLAAWSPSTLSEVEISQEAVVAVFALGSPSDWDRLQRTGDLRPAGMKTFCGWARSRGRAACCGVQGVSAAPRRLCVRQLVAPGSRPLRCGPHSGPALLCIAVDTLRSDIGTSEQRMASRPRAGTSPSSLPGHPAERAADCHARKHAIPEIRHSACAVNYKQTLYCRD